MQTVIAPASAQISGNGRLVILRAVLTPEWAVKRMQHEVDDQCVGPRVRILQSFAQPRLRYDIFVAHGLGNGVFVGCFAMRFFVEAAIVGAVQAVAPVADETMGEDAAMVAAMAIVVGAGERRKNRF